MAEEDRSLIESLELNQASCSMVMIRENGQWCVFPPINHENLEVPLFEQEQQEEDQNTRTSFSPLSSDLPSQPASSSITSSSSTSSFLTSEDGNKMDAAQSAPSDLTVRDVEARDVCGWWRMGLRVLHSRVWGFVWWPSECRNAWRARTFWSFVTSAVLLLSLLYWPFQIWRWWRQREKAEKRLTRLIKEKDEVRHVHNSSV